MYLVEIYNKVDFCTIVKRFVCSDEVRASSLANNGDKDDDFDYRVIAIEQL